MSDDDRKDKNDTEFDDHTAIRQQPNADKTAVKGGAADPDAADSSNKTIVRGKNPTRRDRGKAPSDAAPVDNSGDATIIRGEDERPAASNEDATIIRDEKPAPAGDDDATIIKGDKGPSNPTVSNDSATILRRGDDAASSDSATIMRGAGSPANENATILRGGGGSAANEHATILRGSRGADDSTVMRSNEGGDATVLRGGGGDDDRTVINENVDNDKTVMGGRDGDTTYVATELGGRSASRSRGNTEAGRLLKNRFVLEEKVGSGGMGDVYKALDLRQQEAQERNPYIAIKILNDEFARHKDAFISLQREATRTRGIPHQNIMAVYDFDREGETVFMSMELLDGQPLDDYLRDHQEGVSVEDAWNIIDGICQGLSRAHGAGIVHSDFKPGNIYYTGDKTAKVFDFGIARAVSNPNDLRADGEKTVFDAGSLGALTPTYASYEMLVGKEPTKADDIYAVALVAYELFTGKHPYNRVPADKALERGMEPEPVPFLKRRHWRALRKGLSLKGEDRYETIDEFYEDMFSEDPPYFRYSAIAAVLVASVGFGVYNFFYGGTEIPEEYQSRAGLYDAAEQTLEVALGTLEQLENEPRVNERNWRFEREEWRDETIRQSLARMVSFDTELSAQYLDFYDPERGEVSDEECDPQDKANRIERCTVKQIAPARWREQILNVYLAEVDNVTVNAEGVARDQVEDAAPDATDTERFAVARDRAQVVMNEMERALSYLDEAEDRYGVDPDAIADSRRDLGREMERAQEDLEDAIDEYDGEIARIADEERIAEEQRVEAERVLRRDTIYMALREGAGFVEGAENPQSLRDIMRCKGDLDDADLRDLDIVLNGPGFVNVSVTGLEGRLEHQGMKNTFPEQFELDRPGIMTALEGCISRAIAVRLPERARTVQTQVRAMLPAEDAVRIAAITIEDLDPCSGGNLIGRGNLNNGWCRDRLSIGGDGPELVVLPNPPDAALDAPLLAISRIEIKRSDYNKFCAETGCSQMPGAGSLPVTNISLDQARAYTAWLSDQTGRSYRLPTATEWRYAAETNIPEEIDDNINCFVDARGVRLGDTLLSTLSGRPNKWGLYNFVGNAREWAIDEDGEAVLAMGGAHTDPRSECTLDKQVAHNGNPDPVTGFRIVRTVES